MNKAEFVLENAESQPEKVRDILIELHKKGETVSDILDFIEALNKRKIKINYPELQNKKIFDICGTGGSGKKRINLSSALAVNLSKKFIIAKHGNKAASGKVGSFDLIESLGYDFGDTPEKVKEQILNKNLSFVFAPAFHPALKPLAPIRQKINHPTIFNYLGPVLNPIENITAQMVGVSDLTVGDKLAEVCAHLNKNILLVHDTVFGLDDVSVGGATRFWVTGAEKNKIHSGAFFPEDYGIDSVKDFSEIQGGDVDQNMEIFKSLISGYAKPSHQKFLEINQKVAEEFFDKF